MTIDIRKKWLDYYSAKGYKVIPSAPLIHPAFPMSFNMSAGLVQLDPKIRSPKKLKHTKQCLVQRCFRHFDIDKVGDKTHLSYFEMPAAFEVGDLHEADTVQQLWDFFTETLKIDKRKIWITAFSGGRINRRQIDLLPEVKTLANGLAGKHIAWGDKSNTFWTQGGGSELKDKIRMCGPQVEFFYDLGKKEGCGKKTCNPLCGCGRFLEIGNILFIKYYLDYSDHEKTKDLVNPSTEAAVGLERLFCALEHESDVFQTSYIRMFSGGIKWKPMDRWRKIVWDHFRALNEIYTEEALPSGKGGRKRIIRTLIRRFVTACYMLELDTQKLLAELYASMPGYSKIQENVVSVLLKEEQAYKKTIYKCMKWMAKLANNRHPLSFSQKECESIRSDYGVPAELVEKLCKDNSLAVVK